MSAAPRVAGLQLDLAWEDAATNLARAEAAVAGAAAAGARLAVLPEMFSTGFTMNAAAAAAEETRTREGLAAIARAHGLWLAAGYVGSGPDEGATGDGGRPYNRCGIFDPQGEERLVYRKIHPFSLAREPEHYAAGAALPSLELEGLRVTVLICYDLRFPEPFRAAAERTDLFLVPANWPEARRAAWRTLLRARAIENQAFVLGVNRVGEGDGLRYAGDSALLDPFGRARAEASVAETMVLGEVDAAEVAEARRRYSFLADRRPEVYEGL